MAGNLVEGGARGFRGLPMIYKDDFAWDKYPLRYQAAPVPSVWFNGQEYAGPPTKGGALSYLTDEYGYPGGFRPADPAFYSSKVHLTESDNKLQMSEETNLITFSVGATTGLTGLAGLSIGSFIGLNVAAAVLYGSTAIGGALTAAEGAAAAAASAGVVGYVGVFAGFGVAVFSFALTATRLAAAISEYGWSQEAFAWFLSSPREWDSIQMASLLMGAYNPYPELPEPQVGLPGDWGAEAFVTGSGIFGNATLQGTLIANNKGQRYTRTTIEKVIEGVKVVEFTQRFDNVAVAEYQGNGTSEGGLFVGSASGLSSLPTDKVGSLGNPLDARIDFEVRNHGGDVPTLKLLPNSPARGAVLTTSEQTSQNGYVWGANTQRDIGAWGGPENQPPMAANIYLRATRGGTFQFTLENVLEAQLDPDDDPLEVEEYIPYATVGEWTINEHPFNEKLNIFVLTLPEDFPDFAPILELTATDGQYTTGKAYVYVHVLPDPEECPGTSNGKTLMLGGNSRHYVALPDSAATDHNFTGPFTVEFWYTMGTTPPVPSHEAFVTKGDSAWRVQRYQQTNRVTFDITGLEPLQMPSTRELLNDGKFHHIVAVYDGEYKYLYIDGELDTYVKVTGTPATNSSPVWIGANAERDNRYVTAIFDEVRIWSRALSQEEIRAGATLTLTGYEEGLMTYYRFEEMGDSVYNFALNRPVEAGQFKYSEVAPLRLTSPLPSFGTAVVGRHLFYNESELDGDDPDINELDDFAITNDVKALLPGATVGLMAGPPTVNYRSFYEKGLNGIMIDVVGLKETNLGLADFSFQHGDGGDPAFWDPSTWPAAPSPRQIQVREGVGPCGTHRVTLVWGAADSDTLNAALTRGWLRVTLKASARTGLLSDEVFYCGHGAGTSANTAPEFAGYSFTTTKNRSVTVSLAKLYARASDADGDELVLSADAVSENGAEITLDENTLTYVPPAEFLGTDHFNLTFRDEAGVAVIGKVNVEVIASTSVGNPSSNLANIKMEQGKVKLLFYGIPGRSYILQFSTDLVNWVDVQELTAGANGQMEFTDVPALAGEGTGFYRTVTRP